MKDEEILNRIQKVYRDVTGHSDYVVKPDNRLAGSGEISSFILMELIVELEEEFDIELTYSNLRSIKTVQGLIRFISKQ